MAVDIVACAISLGLERLGEVIILRTLEQGGCGWVAHDLKKENDKLRALITNLKQSQEDSLAVFKAAFL